MTLIALTVYCGRRVTEMCLPFTRGIQTGTENPVAMILLARMTTSTARLT